ncbi:uncharacterized protein H6S33_000794 [Morchella sextelata]|uniref:uncharacterized protein n=1 Tax=Morchella sextelata TaxID=1174677 RepID=UPI001D03FCF5|nr:uncharacterized protein H6S33_000794 [Morchella sextelata]KAH0615158.1 hypothetical protein H6S33_000794 [Morchella sextelata]
MCEKMQQEQRDIETAIEIHVERTPKRGTWREPRRNIFRLFSTYLGFLIYGMNDSTVGALLPSIEIYYGLNYTTVSLIFLAPAIGCVLAAFLTNRPHSKIGRHGVGLLSCGSYTIAYAIVSFHPPFPVIFLLYIITGFGSGLINGLWNSYVSGLTNSSSLLGFLHGFFGIGATISPIIASKLVASGIPWYKYYYILTGLGAMTTAILVTAFWEETGPVYCQQHADSSGMTGGRTLKVIKSKVTILLSAFMLLYLGCELSIGGWIVTFMIRGFKIFNFRSICAWLCFWLIPQFVVSAAMVAMIGFFIGMPIPAAIVVVTKTLPPELHVIAVGFSTAFAVSGSAVVPFAVGALAQSKGVQVLQPIIVALLAAQLGLWFFVPRVAEGKQGG